MEIFNKIFDVEFCIVFFFVKFKLNFVFVKSILF